MNVQFKTPQQRLPKDTYYSEDWFERERALFDQSWTFACTEAAIAQAGDYHCFQFMNHPLAAVRLEDGGVRAFHNICRHRGCEVLEGSGNTGNTIMCPYHRWTYQLTGDLRGVTNENECFPGIEKGSLGLHPAAVGTYRGMVFVNPSPAPTDSFDKWIANMDEHGWPHRFDDNSMVYGGKMTYEMHCNWKVFYENAIDGYHLGYLHDKTLGKLYPDKNIWHPVGRHQVWYSTEWDGPPQSNTVLSEQMAEATPRLPGHEKPHYPGVVMLFPLTILSPSPWGFYVSLLEPVGPELTNMHTHAWAPAGSPGRFQISDADEPIRLVDLDGHPRDSGNFQLEDMWIVEKIQRAMHSPRFAVGPLAQGDGAEGPIMHFQENLLDYVPLD